MAASKRTRYGLPAIALIGAAIAVGCGAQNSGTTGTGAAEDGRNGPLTVVATTGVLCDLAAQVGGDRVAVTCAVPPGQDPHHYAPKPSDRRAFETADVLLYGGYGFDATLQPLVDTSPAPHKLAVFERAVPNPRPMADGEHGGHAHHGHAHGDHAHDEADRTPDQPAAEDSPAVDPHVWHDARHGAALATAIAVTLGDAEPAAADRFRDRAQKLDGQFSAIDAWIRQQVATVPASNRKLVTVHDAFQYFAAAYGMEVAGSIAAIAPQGRVSAKDLRTLVDQLRREQVPALFAETTSDRQGIETLSRESGIAIAPDSLFVEGPGRADSAAPTYGAVLVTNTCTIVNALGGRCNVSTAPGSPFADD